MKRFLLNLILIFCCFFHISTIAQWTQFLPGTYPFSYTTVKAIATDGTSIYSTSNLGDGIFRSTDNGTTWVDMSNGLPSGSFDYTLAIMGNDVFAGTSKDWGIYKTTNSGVQWTQSGLTGIPISSLAKIGTNLFAGSSSGVYLSTDNGANWMSVKPADGIYALTTGGTTLFAARNASTRGVYVSPDNGTNWTFPANTGFPTSNITALSTIGSNLFAETMTGVYLSTDEGANWNAVNTGLTTVVVRSAVVNDNNLFVGTNGGGVFLTTDNGSNWSAVNTGLTNKYVYALAVIGSDLYAGTMGSGLWKRSLSDMVTAVEDKNSTKQPSNFALHQNYPNPFNPTTTLSFAISYSSLVTLKVFDVLGKEIAVLVNENKPAGNYGVNFDASELSSGIYFYKLQAGNFSSTKKMVLTR